MAARRIEVVAPPDPPDPNAFQGEPMSGADACQALGVKDVGSLLRYIRDGRLRARKVKRRTSGRVHLVWEFDSASVVQLQRRPTGRRGAKPKPILLKLAPLHEAIERGELLSLAPEDVREWVVRLRADAYERQEQASAGRRTAPQ